MPKLQKSKNKEGKGIRWSITIPAEMVAIKGWKKEDVLMLAFNANGNIEIEKVEIKKGVV